MTDAAGTAPQLRSLMRLRIGVLLVHSPMHLVPRAVVPSMPVMAHLVLLLCPWFRQHLQLWPERLVDA